MSKLRKKLQQARHEYQHLRYDGNLAADVLDQLHPAKKPSHWLRHLSIAATLAIAATAAIVMLNHKSTVLDVAILTPTENDPTTSVASTTPDSVATNNASTPMDPASNSTASDGTETGTETTEEQRWSVVPSELASASETSFSLVPSLGAFSETGLDSTEAQSVEQ